MTFQNNSHDDNPRKLVVIYAPLGMPGHLIPTAELGNLLVAQGLQVTVVTAGDADQGAGGSFLAGLVAANPSLSFHCLPAATLPSDVPAGISFEAKVFEFARASNPDLRDFLRSASPAALVIDFFCSSALHIGTELGIPTYFFYITCIASVALCLYQPVIHEQTTLSFRDLGAVLVHSPGLPPIPADHMAAALLDRDSWSNKLFLDLSEQLCNSQGVIVNSCRSLEPRATAAIVSSLCTFPGRRTPPLYCVGPLVKPEEYAGAKRHECLAWLDGQPKASVVFLCFGSLGRFSAKQTKQIAAGLETSGQRFLWAVRRPPGDEHQLPDDDLDALFPEGFLQRTRDRGRVVMSWAPQREVLAHGAVGGS
uniref:Uncharacterized protein n=1 Tax=Avena sativa TaxID=4498 RepID=A0ACD5VVE5_AVESA